MCYLNFQGNQVRVAMVTKIGQKESKICTDFSSVQDGDNVGVRGRVFGVVEFKYANKN